MYQNQAQPCVLNVFTPDALRFYLSEQDKKKSMADLQQAVMAKRGDKELFTFGSEVWRTWSEDVIRHFNVSKKNFKFAENLQNKFSVWSEAEKERFVGIVSALQQKGFDWYLTDIKGRTGPLRVGIKDKHKPTDIVLGYLDFLKLPFVFTDRSMNIYHDAGSANFIEWLNTIEDGRKNGGHLPNAYHKDEEVDDESEQNENMKHNIPLNQILYGPPGTGKTYHTIDKALEIFGEHIFDRAEKKARFDELVSNGDIQFVTFHQSFSYEDFVEGLTAQVDEETQHIRYEVSDGVFKRMCESASKPVEQGGDKDFSNLKDKPIWKMSLGRANSQPEIYHACEQLNYVVLGWGDDIDFSSCKTAADVEQCFTDNQYNLDKNRFAAPAVHVFMHKMKVGDLIVISEGNRKFKAIAQITGEYEYLPDGIEGYYQARSVQWLRKYTPALSREHLRDTDFTQSAIHKPAVNRAKLTQLLSAHQDAAEARPKVLIIDEINRGNISKIFGELITLIEPSKRQGADEALSVTLPYSKESFSVPDNLYIIGTMNSADRSLATLDLALRRRFDFIEMPPDASTLEGIEVENIDVQKMFETINQRIEVLLGRDYCIGHAYFLPLQDKPSLALLASIFRNKIMPLLQEYFFEDWERIAQVFNSDAKTGFIVKVTYPQNLFGQNARPDNGQETTVWRINTAAFENPKNYQTIYATVDAQ
ncbi:MAG: AAA family ATPase [Formosimonas sp.]